MSGPVVVVDPDLVWQSHLANAVSPDPCEQVPSLAGALALLTTPGPALLVAGPNAAAEVLADVRDVRAQHPGLLVVLVVSEVSVSFLQETMRSGVYDVVDANAEHDQIRTALESARAELAGDADHVEAAVQAVAPAQLIVVTSAKGGEGCTSLAVNLAALIARDRSVILVEGDARFGDVTLALGLPPTEMGEGFAEVGADRQSVLRHLYDHPSTGLRVLVPPRSTECVDQLSEQHVVEVISVVQSLCDVVVVDAPFRLVELADMLQYADRVLLVSDLDSTSLKNSMIAVQVLGQMATSQVGELVLNRVPKGAKPDLADLERFVGVRVVGPLPEVPTVGESFSAGEPLVQRDPKSGYARAMAELVGLDP